MLQATEFPDLPAFPRALRVALALPGRQSHLADVENVESTVFDECDDAGIVTGSATPLAWRLRGCCLSLFPLSLENKSEHTFVHKIEVVSALRPLAKCITFTHTDQAVYVDIIAETNVLYTIELPHSLLSSAAPLQVRCTASYLTATNNVPPMVLATLPPYAKNGPGCELAVGCMDGSLLSLSRDEPLGQLSFLKLDDLNGRSNTGWGSWLRRPKIAHLTGDSSLALSAPLSVAASGDNIVSVSVDGTVKLWSRSSESAIGQTAGLPAKNEHTGAHVVVSADGSHAAVYAILDDENGHAQFSIYRINSSLVLKRTVAAPRQGFTGNLRNLTGLDLVVNGSDNFEIWASWDNQVWKLSGDDALATGVDVLGGKLCAPNQFWAINETGLAVVETSNKMNGEELANAQEYWSKLSLCSQTQLHEFVANGGSEHELAVIVQDAQLSVGSLIPRPNIDSLLTELSSEPDLELVSTPTPLGAFYMAHSAKQSAETVAQTLHFVLACSSESNYAKALCLAADSAIVRACVYNDFGVLVSIAFHALLSGTKFAWQNLSLLNGQPAAVRPVMQMANERRISGVQACNIANALMFGHNKTLVLLAAYILVCSTDMDAQTRGVGLLLEYCGQKGLASCEMAELAPLASLDRDTAICEATKLCAALNVDPQLQLSLAAAGTSPEASKLACRAALEANELEKAWQALQHSKDTELMAMLLAALRQSVGGRQLFARLDFTDCYDEIIKILQAGAKTDCGFARMLYKLAISRNDFELAAHAAGLAQIGNASEAIASNARKLASL